MTITIGATDNNPAPPSEDIEALLDISDEEFTDVLTDALMDANGPVSQEPDWQCLFAPEVIGRTTKALGQLNLRVQAQLGEVASKLYTERLSKSELATTRKARGGLLLFRSRLISRSAEAREIRQQLHLAAHASRPAAPPRPPRDERHLAHIRKQDEEIAILRNALRILTFAIQDHRLAAVEAGLEPEPQDRQLWAVLDEVEVPYRTEMATLTEMLGSGSWTKERE